MKQTFFILLFGLFCSQTVFAQAVLQRQITDTLRVIANRDVWVGNVTVRNLQVNDRARTVTVTASDHLISVPFRPENVDEIHSAIRSFLPSGQRSYRIIVRAGQNNIEDLIPNYFRNERIDQRRKFKLKKSGPPLLQNLSKPNEITRGLQNRHIALWQSHGWHYNQRLARWEWQRARLFQTVEDLYTQVYVLQFLTPMLENAGANVLIPRERDTQIHEVIVDNDTENSTSKYIETDAVFAWETGRGHGFAHPQAYYVFGENPFAMGTFRQVQTTRNKDEISTAKWIPDIPERGRYAVYVSYRTLPNSTERAIYTVHHLGGTTEFAVNQTMYGGTWLYLGHFYFDEGVSETGKVVLSNYSHETNKIVTADGVKFGGGMGNIARQPMISDPSFRAPRGSSVNHRNRIPFRDLPVATPCPDFTPEVSGRPRFAEASRYWLQWAGVPDSVYSRSRGANDGTDDFQSRGFWVNYISGGSAVAPRAGGLNVPIDLAIAFHTDAGTTLNDSIIGTLAICMTRNTEGRLVYKSGVSRLAARDLSDIIQTQIVSDIRALHAPEWTRRGLWDRSYSEARVPEVPTLLLELLSHQNFADMRYGLDPRFQFTASRAIYKGILRYFEALYGKPFVVQPLPVEQFSIRFTGEQEVELNWNAVSDQLEPSAEAKQFIVRTKIDNGAFDNGILVNENHARFEIEKDRIYSFQIVAVNEGGRSFPSETLSVARLSDCKGEVLIINGFNRLSASASFVVDTTYAGFVSAVDAGVPYMKNIAYIGEQYEFRRAIPWADDDDPGFGASHATNEVAVIAGNTFNFPKLHGRAIKNAGYSFVSTSRMAVENGFINLNDFSIVNLILGKQKETYIGNRQLPPEFKTFPQALQLKIRDFTRNGGNLFISGSNVASDMYRLENADDIAFVNNVLGIRLRNPHGSVRGNVRIVQSPVREFRRSDIFTYFYQPNPISYHVVSPDAIEPTSERGHSILRYTENNLSAGVAFDAGNFRVASFGFPFETIKDETVRNELMKAVLEFLGRE